MNIILLLIKKIKIGLTEIRHEIIKGGRNLLQMVEISKKNKNKNVIKPHLKASYFPKGLAPQTCTATCPGLVIGNFLTAIAVEVQTIW